MSLHGEGQLHSEMTNSFDLQLILRLFPNQLFLVTNMNLFVYKIALCFLFYSSEFISVLIRLIITLSLR